MNTSRKILWYFFEFVILFALLAACTPNAATVTPTVSPYATQHTAVKATPDYVINIKSWVSNPTPPHDGRVIVFGSLIKNRVFLGGIMMKATWDDPSRGRQRECYLLVTYQRGDCIIEVKDFPVGIYVPVTVSFDYRDQIYTTTIGFTPK